MSNIQILDYEINYRGDQMVYMKTKIDFTSNIIDPGSHVLYSYKSEEKYFNNVLSYVSTGLKLGDGILLIESLEMYKEILKRLEEQGFVQDDFSKIVFVDKKGYYIDGFNAKGTSEKLKNLLRPLQERNFSVRIWGNVVCSKVNNIQDLCIYEVHVNDFLEKSTALTVCAYNGDFLPGNYLLRLMKSHKYLMTDNELYPSTLYSDNENNLIINIQENLQNSIEELKRYKGLAQRLERVEVISHMASSISHEVRNPMTTVRGFLQLMKSKKEYHKDSKYFELMISELDRANLIITEFLSLGREKPTQLSIQNINEVIQNIAPLLQASAVETSKYIKLDLKEVPDIPLDSKEICQVLLNLVQNGLDAMASGCVTISTFMENGDIVLSIKDEGSGIAPQILEKIGTPFITTKDNGTGLGLATTYAIIQRHGGKIHVETSPNGTTFYIKFSVPCQ